ncbi:hypothetical protein [Massilia sp. ZL223]|uniref:hypothetical protein n=1 Tax=Massilia sp. ZL223 TaxID=2824904 RepID=UPI001B82A36E|nr:hypothetical protein [Massilia sp. ZL223]MBQ5963144.1 hypothetical protein [Massilia sp. ZL223]
MSSLMLNRDILARLLQGNQVAIRAFEQVFSDVGSFPSTIEEANALAGQALGVAQAAMESLAVLAEALSQLEGAPSPVPQAEQDDTAPIAHLGTMSSQNAEQVEITGGALDGVTIGQTTRASGAFTTFGCNSKAPQASAALGGAATDLATVITLTNNIRAALIANGIGS